MTTTIIMMMIVMMTMTTTTTTATTATTAMMIALGLSEAHPRRQTTYTLAPIGTALLKILYFLHSSRDNTHTHAVSFVYLSVRKRDAVIQADQADDNY